MAIHRQYVCASAPGERPGPTVTIVQMLRFIEEARILGDMPDAARIDIVDDPVFNGRRVVFTDET